MLGKAKSISQGNVFSFMLFIVQYDTPLELQFFLKDKHFNLTKIVKNILQSLHGFILLT